MPETLATGFLVGLVEWACIEAVNSRIDWPREQTLGTHIDMTHEAATPAGLLVTIEVRLVSVEGPKLGFAFEAHDDFDRIARGTHERYIVEARRFDAHLDAKSEQVRQSYDAMPERNGTGS